ncbi:MAG: argininosuccinate lyase [Gammaproteobacteria bacterium]|nr:argininosuccinate lyase [Gammaproteobacteria bacterium]
MSRLWEKGEALDARVLRYTAGEDHSLDERLVPFDVRGSIAHATMLHQQKLLGDGDFNAICVGLQALAASHAAGDWHIGLEDEDAHTALERRLTERIGEAGKRVHLGRSRNDQLLTALRLYLLDAAAGLERGALAVAEALTALGRREAETALPGYTHMQQAMPSSVPLWAEGFAAEIRDDAAGIAATRRRLAKNPLGSAAGYGVPGLPIDRESTRKQLGFDAVQEPVTAVQISRGKGEAMLVFELCLLMQDLGRLAADLLLFYTQEFAFVQLPGNMTTGSSIMPQKRNPDVLELVRGATATLQGALVEVLALPAKLPSGYQRDLQRMKGPLFRAIDVTAESCAVMSHMLGGVAFRPENIHLDAGIYAAGRANRLVLEEGLSFREAYQRVAAELKKAGEV